MADEQTMWSKTLLDGFIAGMKGKPTDAWMRQQAQELGERGMSVDFLQKTLRSDIGEVQAERFLNAVGGVPASAKKPQKKGLLGKLFS